MIPLIIILTLILLCSLTFNLFGDIANRKLDKENRNLQYEKSNLLNAANDMHPKYVVLRYEFCMNIKFVTWAVYRISKQNDKVYYTLIKFFHDDDDDFNLREAEELCEILNSL